MFATAMPSKRGGRANAALEEPHLATSRTRSSKDSGMTNGSRECRWDKMQDCLVNNWKSQSTAGNVRRAVQSLGDEVL